MIGSGVLEVLCEEIKDEINDLFTHHKFAKTDSSYIRVFSKATVRGTTFFSKNNKRVKKRNSYTVSYVTASNPVNYGLIENFFTVDCHHMAVLQNLQIVDTLPPRKLSGDDLTTRALLFEDYLIYSEGARKVVFMHQIERKCCNLTNSHLNILTPNVNNVELE